MPFVAAVRGAPATTADSVAWAHDRDSETSGAKPVLVTLAYMASAQTGAVVAGRRGLAALTGQRERSVRRLFASLAREGFISRQLCRRSDGSRTSDVITFNAGT